MCLSGACLEKATKKHAFCRIYDEYIDVHSSGILSSVCEQESGHSCYLAYHTWDLGLAIGTDVRERKFNPKKCMLSAVYLLVDTFDEENVAGTAVWQCMNRRAVTRIWYN